MELILKNMYIKVMGTLRSLIYSEFFMVLYILYIDFEMFFFIVYIVYSSYSFRET